MDLLYNHNRHKYINICKYLKKTAYINTHIIRLTIKLTHSDDNKKIMSMISIHNDLLDKFEKLYTKFMNLVDYIQQTGPKIFDLDKFKIHDIKSHIDQKSYKLDIERFDTNIVYYLNNDDKKILYNYLIERKQDLYDKIEKILDLIKRLDEITLNFRERLINL